MEQYIPKSALVAEIEKKEKYAQTLGDNAINSSMQQFYDGMKQGCVDILSSIDTLEVKEIDDELQGLEKEVAEGSMSKYPKVTDELCMRCIYGYPCEMWDEREVPEEGEECPNFIAKCETEQERDQRIMNGGATIADALSWFKWQARVVATPTTVATMLSRKIIETLEEDIKREEFVRKEMECINDYRKEAQERLKED